MTISTQNLTELQTKVLKIAKGLGRFTVDDVTPILGVFDYQVQTAVSPLMELGYIKMISDREYLYTRHSNPAGNRQSRPLVLQPNDSNDDNDPIDPWLTIEEAARLLNNKPNTVLRKCLHGNFKIKLNTNKELEGKYLIKKSSLNLYSALKDDEIKFLDRETKKLFRNKDEERLYITASDRGKEFIYKYLKLFKMTEGFSSAELRQFLELIAIQNPKLKVSYPQFYSKRKTYQQYGMRAIFPKSFMPEYKDQETTTKRNLNRLPKAYGGLSTDQIEIIYKCFCFGLPSSQTSKLANLGDTTIETVYKYIRAKIFDTQYNELIKYQEKMPQKPKSRVFIKDQIVYFYCYDKKVYVTKTPLKEYKFPRPMSHEEDQEVRRMYCYLSRKQLRNSMRLYFEHHIATLIWKERNCNFEDQLNKIFSLIHC